MGGDANIFPSQILLKTTTSKHLTSNFEEISNVIIENNIFIPRAIIPVLIASAKKITLNGNHVLSSPGASVLQAGSPLKLINSSDVMLDKLAIENTEK